VLWHDLKALRDVEALRGFDLTALQGAPDYGPKQRARLAAIGAELARERLSVSRIDPTMPRDRAASGRRLRDGAAKPAACRRRRPGTARVVASATGKARGRLMFRAARRAQRPQLHHAKAQPRPAHHGSRNPGHTSGATTQNILDGEMRGSQERIGPASVTSEPAP
jgi:hypothetical protein